MNLEPEFRPSVDQKFEIGCIDGGPVTVGGKLVVNSFMHVNGHQLVATDDFDSAELCTGTHSGVMWDQTCILNFTVSYLHSTLPFQSFAQNVENVSINYFFHITLIT